MKTVKITEPWVPDQSTYNHILEVQKFATFLSNLAITTNEQKEKLLDIKATLKSFNKTGIKKQFMMGLDIFDKDHYSNVDEEEYTNNQNFYWRKWLISFELNSLEIVMETEAGGTNAEIYEKEPFYSAAIYFEKKLMPRRVFWETPFSEFIKDVMHYRKYITENHNILEVDVHIW